MCSAFHPTAVASPFFIAFGADLERHGLRWRWPEIQLAHPFDDGSAGVMFRSIDETAAGLGPDGKAWRRTFGPLTEHLGDLVEDIFDPILHVPRHPFRLTSFGLRALLPATLLARRWHDEPARALFAGVAAHAMYPLTRPMTSSVGLFLTAVGHAHGWPAAEGGSQAIADALTGLLAERGGTITTGRRVDRVDELDADLVLLDVAPGAAAEMLGDRLPSRIRRRYRRYRHGPAAHKVDLAVDGGVPWTNESCRTAGTVHLGGPLEEMVATEAAVHRGRMPERPFVLVGQQYLCDPGRSVGDVHPVWAYAHVPSGFTGNATEAVIAQIERFAPGIRDRIVGVSTSVSRRPRRPQRELHRRRHRQRGQRSDPDRVPARDRSRCICNRCARRVPVFSGDPAGGRYARHVRVQRRPIGAASPPLTTAAGGRMRTSPGGNMVHDLPKSAVHTLAPVTHPLV